MPTVWLIPCWVPSFNGAGNTLALLWCMIVVASVALLMIQICWTIRKNIIAVTSTQETPNEAMLKAVKTVTAVMAANVTLSGGSEISMLLLISVPWIRANSWIFWHTLVFAAGSWDFIILLAWAKPKHN